MLIVCLLLFFPVSHGERQGLKRSIYEDIIFSRSGSRYPVGARKARVSA